MIHSENVSGDHKMQYISVHLPCFQVKRKAKQPQRQKQPHVCCKFTNLIDTLHNWLTDYIGCFTFLHFTPALGPRRMLKQPPIGFISLVHNRLALLEVTAIAFRLCVPHETPLAPQ